MDRHLFHALANARLAATEPWIWPTSSTSPLSWISIELLLGVSAASLSPAEHRLHLSDGSSLRYARLLIATGSRARRLPALERYENVSMLRTVDDSLRLRELLTSRTRLAILGAGFIGQEVASTARKLGAKVTMIEAAPCPLAGILGEQLGGWFTRLHAREGVEVLTNTTVQRVDGNGRVDRLHLSGGTTVGPDHVIVGIGIDPDTGWLAGSGLDTPSGVPVDAHGRTALEAVFAAGDAAATFDPALGRRVPGSHWEAAGRQGARAARLMLGLDPGPAPLTTFWTDQYGIRIQYLGDARGADRIEIDGHPEARNFTATFTRSGRPVAALLVDRPRSLPSTRKLIEKGTT
jgi:NADPH-dependent 2,4-dienoyl-CoA reductase/sulfur reductase-like enzyme